MHMYIHIYTHIHIETVPSDRRPPRAAQASRRCLRAENDTYVYIYIYIYICMYVCVYLYICINNKVYKQYDVTQYIKIV